MVNNRERVGRSLDRTAEALEPFIAKTMAPHVPSGTEWPTVLRALDESEGHNRDGTQYAPGDLQCQLRVITERIGQVGFPFSDALSRGEQNLAGELREIQNKWAYQSPFNFDDTYRALDTMERLLRAAGQPGTADKIKADRVDLQRTQIESETRKDVRESLVIGGLGDVDLTPWRKVLQPHPDVLSGRFKESEFAANLHSVAHEPGSTSQEYADPVEFFRRTFLTGGLKDLLTQAANRITGRSGSPVINLQTTFGGGKTHSMLAVWHLFSEVSSASLPQELQEILHEAGLTNDARFIRRVAIVGNEIAAGQARERGEGISVRTLWGELARQLGGREGYDLVADSDANSTSPGDLLRELLAKYAPCVILIDEWVAYARQLSEEALPGGTFETQFTFAQALTEAVAATPGVLLLVSIPASDVRREDGDAGGPLASDLETGGEHGKAALKRLEHVVGRVAHQWHPASAQESFEIVRRRLFEQPDAAAFRSINATARKFVNFYRAHSGEFPRDTTEASYEARIKSAYPIHPELFARLYEDWSTLERFQRTRGVLRLMSAVVHELYEDGDDSALIMPGSVPISAPPVVGELTQYVDMHWKSVIDADVDGIDSLPFQIDKERPLFGDRGLTRRTARATFLGSAATLQSAHKGIERMNIFLGVAMPGDTVGNFGSSLQMLSDRASYLFSEGDRFWYDLQPSLNRTVKERAANLHDEDIWAEVVARLRQFGASPGADIAATIVAPDDSSDVPEAESVRLVLVHPRCQHKNKDTDSTAMRFAHDVVQTRGSGNRERRNTLVFLAADEQRYAELESAVRQHLAWRSVVRDKDRLDLTQQRVALATSKVDETNKIVDQRIATSWIWALHPRNRVDDEPFVIGVVKADGDEARLAVRTGKKLVREDILRVQIASSTVRYDLDSKLHRVWNRGSIRVGDLWDYYTKYPYLPRLRDKWVLTEAIADVMMDIAWPQAGFALASGYDSASGDFIGLAIPHDDVFGAITDDTYLVAPHVAQAQRQREQKAAEAAETKKLQKATPTTTTTTTRKPFQGSDPVPTTQFVKRARYRGRLEVDASQPDAMGENVKQAVEEVLRHIAAAEGAENVEIVLDVRAENPLGFSESVARTVKENSHVLGFDISDFEDVEW
jgi:predicted AAA+ superfamily ATPase